MRSRDALRGDVFEEADFSGFRIEFEAFGNAFVGVAIHVAFVPDAVALLVGPIGEEPDFVGLIDGAEDIEADEAFGGMEEVWAGEESFLDLAGHAVGDGEFADGDKEAAP